MPVRLRYTDVQLLTAASNFTSYTYRSNSPFDPDLTGTGAQPNFFDTFSAIYQKYRVLRCHWKVTVCSRTGTGGQLCVAPSTATTGATMASVQNAGGLPGARVVAFGGAGAPPGRLSGTWRVGEFYGMTDAQVMADPNFLALTTANTGNQVYLACVMDTAGATDTVDLTVELEMDTYFEMRAYQAQN